MQSSWETLRERLRRSVSTLRSQQEFDGARRRRANLERFPDPASLLDFLGERHEDLDAVDDIYAALIREVQDDAGAQQTAMALLWLGLWPGLDAAYHHLQRLFDRDEHGLVDAIIGVFTCQIDKANLSGISRLAATLVMNTRRDVRGRRLRDLKDEVRRPDIPADDALGGPDEGDELERQDLRARMLAAAGPYRPLLEAIIFRDLDVKAAAVELGIPYRVALEQYARLLERLRTALR